LNKPVFNGNTINFRYTLTFAKYGPARFLGHLDLQTLFHRALNRAKLPASYSKGFNPHLLVSFAQPLPLGMTSRVELIDIDMDEPVTPEELIARLNKALPDGIEILSAVPMEIGAKTSASAVSGALYEMEFPFDDALRQGMDGAIRRVRESELILIDKKTKSSVAQADIRPDIALLHNISTVERIAVSAVLATGSYRNLKPEFAARLLCEYCNVPFQPFAMRYTRLKIYLNGMGGLIGDEPNFS